MLSPGELKKKKKIIIGNYPYEVVDSALVFKGRGQSVIQVKLKNLINGNVISRVFHQGEKLEEADILKKELKFLYSHRGQYFFSEKEDPSKRISFNEENIGLAAGFLKGGQVVEGLVFKGKIVSISLPIKIKLKIAEAPPGIKAGRAEAGTKQAVLESGAKINVPLFVEEGDVIEVNTETGEYVKRV